MNLPDDLKDFNEDSFQIIDPEIAGAILAGLLLLALVFRDVARMV